MSNEIRSLFVVSSKIDVDFVRNPTGLSLTCPDCSFLVEKGKLGVLIVVAHRQTISLVRTQCLKLETESNF